MNKRRKGKEARRNLRERETRLDKIEKMLKDFLKSMVELRKSIAELREAQKKTDEQMRLTDERLEKLKMETEKFKMETLEQMRERDERLEKFKMETLEQMRERDERLEKIRMETEKFRMEAEKLKMEAEKLKMETFEQMRLTDERIEKRIGKLTDAQGLFWESLSEKGIIKFLEDEGYEIRKVLRDCKSRTKTGKEAEFDLIIEAEKDGKKEVFIAEVKTTATPHYVDEFLAKLSDIIEFFPEYEGKTIWGVFSSGRYADGTEKYAISKGLVVFGISGEVLVLLNPRTSLKPFLKP
jgi:chromosome segregation ATPase